MKIALISGFASVRRFNAAFLQHYGLNPTQLRRKGAGQAKQYIAMWALRWPDAFPAGDVALHKAQGVQDAKSPAREALAVSAAWKPWRSYAVIRAWASLPEAAKAVKTVKKPATAQIATNTIALHIIPTRATVIFYRRNGHGALSYFINNPV